MKKLIALTIIILSSYIFSQNGASWIEQTSGVTTRLNCVAAFSNSPQTAWICGDNGIVLKTLNGGGVWERASGNIPSGIHLNTICVTPSAVLTAGNIGNNTFVYRSSDGGSSWQIVFSQQGGRINSIAAQLFNNSEIFLTGNPVSGRWSIWGSSDQGITWDSAGMFLPQSGNETGLPNSMCIRKRIDIFQIWFGTNNNRIYYSSNYGMDWQAEQVPEQNIYSISVNGVNSPYYLYTEGFSGGNNLFRTSDAGNLWNNVTSGGSGPINSITSCEMIIIPVDNYSFIRTWYIRNNKIYYSGNNGSSWSDEYTTSKGTFTNLSDGYSSMVLWAVTENGGISRGTIDLTPVEPPDTYPYSFKLMQNYPNPFNPVTKISIQLYKDTHLKLNVYNSSGEMVSELLDEYVSIPPIWIKYYPLTDFTWDGTNYPSGVYFYRVIADDYTETKRMVLVK